MQEEVEQKTINLAVRTLSISGRALYNALNSYFFKMLIGRKKMNLRECRVSQK